MVSCRRLSAECFRTGVARVWRVFGTSLALRVWCSLVADSPRSVSALVRRVFGASLVVRVWWSLVGDSPWAMIPEPELARSNGLQGDAGSAGRVSGAPSLHALREDAGAWNRCENIIERSLAGHNSPICDQSGDPV